MDEQTRNQLTGAVVWFLGLIVLVGHWYNHPVDFQPGGAAPEKTTDKPIVDKPMVVRLPTVPPKTLPQQAPEAARQPQSAPAAPTPKVMPAQQPQASTPSAKPAQDRWLVKVAAYFNAREANNLVAALNEAGYDATYKVFKNRKGQTVYSVRVGPYASREAALAAKRRIDKRWRANSLIERVKTEQ